MKTATLLFAAAILSTGSLPSAAQMAVPLPKGVAPAPTMPVGSRSPVRGLSPGERLPHSLPLELVKVASCSFGAADSPDPFGVEYSGPLEKQASLANDPSEFTLRRAVALLNVQAILADSHEAFINNYLLHENDRFQLVYPAGTCEITIESIDAHGIEFRWDKDATTAIYVPPDRDDIFSPQPADQDLSSDQQPLIDVGTNNELGKGNGP